MEGVSEKISWNEAKELISQSAKRTSSNEVLGWSSRVKATNILKRILREAEGQAAVFSKIAVGDYGLCRYRELQLIYDPLMNILSPHKFFFGEVYRIVDLDLSRKEIEIQGKGGKSGWIEMNQHLPITRGEYKIINSSRNLALNFLISCLSAKSKE